MNMKKRTYEQPEMDLVRLSFDDIVTISDETPMYSPFSKFRAKPKYSLSGKAEQEDIGDAYWIR